MDSLDFKDKYSRRFGDFFRLFLPVSVWRDLVEEKIPLVLHDKIIPIVKILDALVITQQTSAEDSKSDDIDQAEWFLVDLIDHALD